MANFELKSHEELNVHREKVLANAMFAPVLAVDTETNGEDIRDGRGFCIGISIAYRFDGTVEAAYYPIAHTKNNVSLEVRKALKNIILSRAAIVCHNLKFDKVSLATADIDIHGKLCYCTMLMAHFMNENLMSKGLDFLSKKLLRKDGKLKGPDWELAHKLWGWSPDFPSEIMDRYATGDAVDTLEIFEKGYKDFVRAGFHAKAPSDLTSLY